MLSKAEAKTSETETNLWKKSRHNSSHNMSFFQGRVSGDLYRKKVKAGFRKARKSLYLLCIKKMTKQLVGIMQLNQQGGLNKMHIYHHIWEWEEPCWSPEYITVGSTVEASSTPDLHECNLCDWTHIRSGVHLSWNWMGVRGNLS